MKRNCSYGKVNRAFVFSASGLLGFFSLCGWWGRAASFPGSRTRENISFKLAFKPLIPQGDFKLLSGFPLIGHGNSDNNLESTVFSLLFLE
jgi:hypothetical protein